MVGQTRRVTTDASLTRRTTVKARPTPRMSILALMGLLALFRRRSKEDRARIPAGPAPEPPPEAEPPAPEAVLQGERVYAVLAPAERALVSRLSLFPGGYTPDWKHVLDDPGAGVPAPDMLTQLVGRGVLEMTEDPSGQERYRVPDAWRTYAHWRLVQDGEARFARRFYDEALYLAQRTESTQRASSVFSPLHPEEFVRRLLEEHGNLRAALAWSVGRRDVDYGVRLAAALWDFWWSEGHSADLRSWVRGSLDRLPGDPRIDATVLGMASDIARRERDFHKAQEYANARLEKARAVKNPHAVLLATLALADLALLQDDAATARARFQEVADHVPAGAWFLRLAALRGIGRACLASGDRSAAQRAFTEELRFAQSVQDNRHLLDALQHLADFALEERDIPTATVDIDDAIERIRRTSDRASLGHALGSAGIVRAAGGDFHGARTAMEESLAIAMEFGNKVSTAALMGYLATLATARREDEVARSMFEESVRLARETENKDVLEMVVRFMLQMAEVMGQRRAFAEAGVLCERAEEVAHDEGFHKRVAQALIVHGRALRAAGRREEATRLVEDGLAKARETGDRLAMANALLTQGHLALDRRDAPAARERFAEALRFVERRWTPLLLPALAFGFMRLCAAEGHGENATVLSSAFTKLRANRPGVVWDVAPPPPTSSPEEQKRSFRIEVLRRNGADLPDAAFNEAWERGAAMGADQIFEFVQRS